MVKSMGMSIYGRAFSIFLCGLNVPTNIGIVLRKRTHLLLFFAWAVRFSRLLLWICPCGNFRLAGWKHRFGRLDFSAGDGACTAADVVCTVAVAVCAVAVDGRSTHAGDWKFFPACLEELGGASRVYYKESDMK